jgi:uncharacterized protein YcbK (DUF882 family)
MFEKAGRKGAIGSRRDVLKVLGGVGAVLASGTLSTAHASVPPVPEIKPSAPDFLSLETRELTLENRHTGERLVAAYFDGGAYVDDALGAITHLMRDFRNDQEHPVDTNLLDILTVVHGRLASTAPIQIVSGYRSPATNAALAAQNDDVAKNSYHLYGQAFDVRLTDRRSGDIYNVALNLAAGGAANYGRSNFVHIDSGPVRTW